MNKEQLLEQVWAHGSGNYLMTCQVHEPPLTFQVRYFLHPGSVHDGLS